MTRGLLFIISSPSGAGKTTLCQKVLEQDKRLTLSVSATTRPPRPSESPGKDYFFFSPETFKTHQQSGAFLESAHVFGNWYGTPRQAVEDQLSQGRDVLFDVDWQGARAIAQKWASSGVVRIFILPPSLEELEKRLHSRGQDTEEVVRQRMDRALSEMSHWAEYDYVLINHAIEETVEAAHHIIGAERLKRIHQPDLFERMHALNPIKEKT